jgi:uncharacterized membrane protein
MSNRVPTPVDRTVSHVAVGLAVGVLAGSKTGVAGFFVAGLVGAVAHAAFDAPLAQVVADLP